MRAGAMQRRLYSARKRDASSSEFGNKYFVTAIRPPGWRYGCNFGHPTGFIFQIFRLNFQDPSGDVFRIWSPLKWAVCGSPPSLGVISNCTSIRARRTRLQQRSVRVRTPRFQSCRRRGNHGAIGEGQPPVFGFRSGGMNTASSALRNTASHRRC